MDSIQAETWNVSQITEEKRAAKNKIGSYESSQLNFMIHDLINPYCSFSICQYLTQTQFWRC